MKKLNNHKANKGLRSVMSVMLVLMMFASTLVNAMPIAASEITDDVVNIETSNDENNNGEIMPTDVPEMDASTETPTDIPVGNSDVQTTDNGDNQNTSNRDDNVENGVNPNVGDGHDPTPTQAVVPVGLFGITPFSITDSGNRLQVKISQNDSTWADIDDIGNAITWPLSTSSKQIQVIADFSEVDTTKIRTIEIDVPAGYKILAYTAKSTTPAISGVAKLNLSGPDENKVASSLLADISGDTSDLAWRNQRITGYTPMGSSVETNVRTYAGKVFYSFNSNCDNITLTLTLGLHSELMPHNNAIYTLDDLRVKMTSGAVPLETYLSTDVLELAVHRTGLSISKNVLEGEAGQTTEVFESIQSNTVNRTETGTQRYLCEEYKTVFSYPEGACFVGFSDGYSGVSAPTDSTGGTYANGHLEVEVNTIARTVTFIYQNVTIGHTSSARPLWEIDMPSDWDGTDKEYIFSIDTTIKSGGAFNQLQIQNLSATQKVTVREPKWNIVLSENANASKRHDYNSNGDFPYDYALGAFNIRNDGPSAAEELIYEWEFPEELAIRAVSFPGISANGDEITNITAIAAKANGSTRFIDLGQQIFAGGTDSAGIMVRAEDLGLDADEYLLSLRATQERFSAVNPSQQNTSSVLRFYGRYQNGETGTVNLKITDGKGEEISRSVTPSIVWDNVITPLSVITNVNKTVWYPGDTVSFGSTLRATGNMYGDASEVVDPIIAISLPKGVQLDLSSVQGFSLAGNHDNDRFDLEFISQIPQTIEGVVWTTYKFKPSNNHDMIAQSVNMRGINYVSDSISIFFNVVVDTSCQAYGQIAARDLITWDLNRTAVGNGANRLLDENNKLGKGTSYYGAAAAPTGGTYSVVPQPGLTVSAGIRIKDSGSEFITYNGTQAGIAAVTPVHNAEIQISYQNTDTSAYYPGSEIYLPIPKQGLGYDNYFNNIDPSPYQATTNATPQFSMELVAEPALPGFDTLYSVDTTGTANGAPMVADNTWVPVPDSFMTYADLLLAGKTLADVTMVKFVASQMIAGNTGDSGIFEVKVVGSTAVLEEQNFFRTYQKGWKDTLAIGSWNYGGVLAAEPAVAGVQGMVFEDVNVNGAKNGATEDYDNSVPKVTAILSERTNKIIPITGIMAADGSFKFVDSAGNLVPLKAGEYTITIENADTSKGFTPVTSGTDSSATVWYMNIAQANIAANKTRGTYTFTLVAGGDINTKYVGVGLVANPTVTFQNGTGVLFTQTTASVYHGATLSAPNVPSTSDASVTVQAGYDVSSATWTLNKAVTLTDNTVIPAGTAITRAQLLSAKITEDVTAVMNLTPPQYTITVTVAGGIGGTASSNNTTVNYNGHATITATPATGYQLTSIKVNNVEKGTTTPLTITDIQENQNVIVTFEPLVYNIVYVMGTGETNPASNPSSYTYGVGVPASPGFADATKTGHTFVGWFDDAVAGTQVTSISTISNGTVTLYSRFTANQNSVTYQYDSSVPAGAPSLPSVTNYGYGATVTNPIVAVDGYTFNGWTSSQVNATGTSFIMPNEPVVVEGSWTPKSVNYIVKHFKQKVDLSGYDEVMTDEQMLSGLTDTTVTISAKDYSSEGLVFDGTLTTYAKTATPASTTVLKVAGDGSLVICLYYKRTTASVKYEYDGVVPAGAPTQGSTGFPNDATATVGDTITRSAPPTMVGYTFNGWTTSDVLVNTYGTFIMPAGTVTFKGEWVGNPTTPYTVEHYLQNLDGSYDDDDMTGSPVEVDNGVGQTNETATYTVKSGVGFEGFTNDASATTWQDGTNTASSTELKVAADGSLVIKVYYTRNSYAVEFKYLGTVPAGAPVLTPTTSYKVGATVNAAQPVLQGYDFTGWHSSEVTPDASGDFTMPAKNVTLAGTWIPKSDTAYIVKHWQQTLGTTTYTEVPGSLENETGVTDTDAFYSAIAPASLLGFEYVAAKTTWGNSTVNPATTTKLKIAADGSLVINLYYDRKVSNVTYSFTGAIPAGAPTKGSAGYPNDATYEYGTADIAVSTSPTLAGYTFSGWTTVNATVVNDEFDMPANDVTFTGHWILGLATQFKVEHYKANVDGTYNAVADEVNTLHGTTNGSAHFSSKIYDGFVYDSAATTWEDTFNSASTTERVIAADGSLIVKLHYKRAEYDVSFMYTGAFPSGMPSVPASFNAVYGSVQDVTSTVPSLSGYTFTGWTSNQVSVTANQFTMPSKDVLLYGHFTAQSNINYKVEHYVQKLGQTIYERVVADDEIKIGTTDAPAIYAAKYYLGFTYHSPNTTWQDSSTGASTSQLTVAGDGTLVIKLYYNRNKHNVTYAYTGAVPSGAPSAPASSQAEFVEEVTIANEPTLQGYTFSGWTTSAGIIVSPPLLIFFGGEKFDMIDAPVAFSGNWVKGTGTKYKVEHYQQDVLDVTQYDKVDTEDLVGTTDENAIFMPRNFEGFEYRGDKTTWQATNKPASTTKLTIAPDGSLVIKVYYDRKAYEVSFIYRGAVPTGVPALPAKETIRFNSGVTVSPLSFAGYTFKGWSSADVTVTNNQFNMPAKNITLVGEWIKQAESIDPTPTPGGGTGTPTPTPSGGTGTPTPTPGGGTGTPIPTPSGNSTTETNSITRVSNTHSNLGTSMGAKTGDTTNLVLILVALMLSGAALLYMTNVKRRRNANKRK